MVKYILIRWGILAAAIAATTIIMPGVTVYGEGINWLINLVIVSAVLGLVNAIVRPIITLLTCPLVMLTLGLFLLVINAMMLSLTSWLLPNILTVDGFWTTFFASLIISIISGLLNMFVTGE